MAVSYQLNSDVKELTLEKLDLPQSNRQCPNCRPQAYAPQDSYNPKFIKFIENIIRSVLHFFSLYLLSVMRFSSVNLVDSNIAPSCPKVGHTYLWRTVRPECEGACSSCSRSSLGSLAPQRAQLTRAGAGCPEPP